MQISQQISEYLQQFIHEAANERFEPASYKQLCEYLHIAKMYYTVNFGGKDRYRDYRTGKPIVAKKEEDQKIILYDSARESGETIDYVYDMNGQEYVHAYMELCKDVDPSSIDYDLYRFITDTVYLFTSHRSMRHMLEYAENTDATTGIPNIACITRKYHQLIQKVPPSDLVLMRVNLQNFKYINEAASPKCGDEAIIQYARKIVNFVDEDEAVGRLGGDNFIVFIFKNHLDGFLKKISGVTITQLESAPKQSFEISAWVGISELEEGRDKPFLERFNEASVACVLGKTTLKKSVVKYSEELSKIVNRGHDIIANFRPAIRNNEFHPYFQPKIDMRDGSLVGFEAICRWLHAGRVIYPDQFIPVLDKEGLIPELDLAILDRTCVLIKKWKDSCLDPPTVSINFSKKNLFVPEVEYTIMDIVKNNGLTFDDVEIEITESVREAESERLIEFIRNLKDNGMRISIDDFGTGYSSLALIHSIDADVIKIDKSFIRQLPDDAKSRVLLESIISIADRLNMTTVAEGVETVEQGKELLNLGCNIAQGYYYSKPVDWETATKMIKNPEFKLMK